MQIPTFVNWTKEAEIKRRFASVAKNYNEYTLLRQLSILRVYDFRYPWNLEIERTWNGGFESYGDAKRERDKHCRENGKIGRNRARLVSVNGKATTRL